MNLNHELPARFDQLEKVIGVVMELGSLIRDLRLARGWSQARLADELCTLSGNSTVTREDVSRWENGKRHPRNYWLRHLAATLDVHIRVLEGARVYRREFITNVAASAIAQLVASDIIRSGFTAMLDGRSPGADEWLEKLEAYGRDYMTLGAAKLQQELAGDLVVLQQRLEDPHLWSVAARLMTLFGKTIPGADGAKAVQWYKMAAAAADRSHEMETRVWVRGRAAIALGYEGACLPLAESFAEQAIEICDRPSLGRLNAVMGKAHAAAIRGDRSEALRLNQEGQRIFDLVGSCDQDSDYSVPEWRMAVFQSLLMARMGEEKKAAHSQDVASKNLPVSLPRFATHIEMHRGLMLARSGDYEGGVRYAEQALNELPVERHSLTLRMLLEEIKKTPTS